MDFLSRQLFKKTMFFGLKLWIVICIGMGILLVLMLFVLSSCMRSRKRSKNRSRHNVGVSSRCTKENENFDRRHGDKSRKFMQENEMGFDSSVQQRQGEIQKHEQSRQNGGTRKEEWASMGNSKKVIHPSVMAFSSQEHGMDWDARMNRLSVGFYASVPPPAVRTDGGNHAMPSDVVSRFAWGHRYTVQELESATNSFSDSNILGEGGYGIVYWGLLLDRTRIAVKIFPNHRGQAEREFKVEVEAIGRVRHKNLVRLIGYCMDGSQRALVYEYIENGSLERWLHPETGDHLPLSWDVRMKIILGTAKGLAYLHEGLEPKVVHRDIKSSNILLDSQWNPKIADFGVAKVLGTAKSNLTTRVMGTFGYVAPEYALTGVLTEKSDVYSYGVLVMEVVTGRFPVDLRKAVKEINLVDWLNGMVSTCHYEEVLDPRIDARPPSRALKRVLLVALQCIDPNVHKRPSIGQVVHMLEADDKPFLEDSWNSVTSHTGMPPGRTQYQIRDQTTVELGNRRGFSAGDVEIIHQQTKGLSYEA